MSFPTTVYLSEEQITQTSSTQTLPLGTRGCAEDGRVFRYAQAAATAIKANRLCISLNDEGPASTATDQRLYSAYAVGTTMVQIYLSTIALPVLTANYFKDGYLMVNSTDVAAYQVCPIHSNEALTSATAALGTAGAGNTVWLKQPGLKKLGDTDTGNVKLVRNPYKGLVISTVANGPGVPIGVTPVAVTASYYFWVQTWGPTIAFAGEGVSATIDKAAGLPMYWSTAVAGGVGGASTGSTACGSTSGNAPPADTDTGFAFAMGKVGTLMTAAPAANMYCMLSLTLAP